MRDYNYNTLRAMDGVIVASKKPASSLIRMWTARLKGFKGLKEMFRLRIGSHFGYIVEMNKRFWIAEMLASGLQIRSMREYLKDYDRERIISIVRHPIFEDEDIRKLSNEFVVATAHNLVNYDRKGSPGAFIGLCGEGPENWYCSEMGENIVMRVNSTWDDWQLKRKGKEKRIAPVEIQFGKYAKQINNFIIES